MSALRLIVNGKPETAASGITVAGLLAHLGIDPARVAVERNEEVVPRKTWQEAVLGEGDQIEIVAFIGGGSDGASPEGDDALVIGGRRFRSRLLIGTGKYKSVEETRAAIERTGAEIVTVALRRVDLTPGAPSVLDAIDRQDAHHPAQHRRLLHRRGGDPHLPAGARAGAVASWSSSR